jgi:hypothetical protein
MFAFAATRCPLPFVEALDRTVEHARQYSLMSASGGPTMSKNAYGAPPRGKGEASPHPGKTCSRSPNGRR